MMKIGKTQLMVLTKMIYSLITQTTTTNATNIYKAKKNMLRKKEDSIAFYYEIFWIVNVVVK